MPVIPDVLEMFARIEAGATSGQVARDLNASGVRTQRGNTWNATAVRGVITNPAYKGEKGYERIISPERWQAANDQIKRIDPAAVQARKGGRPATGDYPAEARRVLRVVPVSAVVEARVVEHLEHFIADLEAWLTERARKASTERDRFAEAVAGQRGELRKLQLRAEPARQVYADLLDAGSSLAATALEEVSRAVRDAEGLEEALQAAERRLAEWPTEADVDAALDFYAELRDLIDGRIRAAASVRDVNQALRAVLEGAWLSVDDEWLHGRFVMRVGDATHGLRAPLPQDTPIAVIPPRDTRRLTSM